MAYIRKVKTKSGATAAQVVQKAYGRIVDLKHIGSGKSQADVLALKQLAGEWIERQSGQRKLFRWPGENSTDRLLGKYRYLGFRYGLIAFDKTNLEFDFSFVLYDITTLYFETFKGDKFRRIGFSKDNKPGRPVYHFKARTITAHILICVTALAVLKWLEITTGKEILLRSEISEEISRLLKKI